MLLAAPALVLLALAQEPLIAEPPLPKISASSPADLLARVPLIRTRENPPERILLEGIACSNQFPSSVPLGFVLYWEKGGSNILIGGDPTDGTPLWIYDDQRVRMYAAGVPWIFLGRDDGERYFLLKDVTRKIQCDFGAAEPDDALNTPEEPPRKTRFKLELKFGNVPAPPEPPKLRGIEVDLRSLLGNDRLEDVLERIEGGWEVRWTTRDGTRVEATLTPHRVYPISRLKVMPRDGLHPSLDLRTISLDQDAVRPALHEPTEEEISRTFPFKQVLSWRDRGAVTTGMICRLALSHPEMRSTIGKGSLFQPIDWNAVEAHDPVAAAAMRQITKVPILARPKPAEAEAAP